MRKKFRRQFVAFSHVIQRSINAYPNIFGRSRVGIVIAKTALDDSSNLRNWPILGIDWLVEGMLREKHLTMSMEGKCNET
jgi:hypothetical protein